MRPLWFVLRFPFFPLCLLVSYPSLMYCPFPFWLFLVYGLACSRPLAPLYFPSSIFLSAVSSFRFNLNVFWSTRASFSMGEAVSRKCCYLLLRCLSWSSGIVLAYDHSTLGYWDWFKASLGYRRRRCLYLVPFKPGLNSQSLCTVAQVLGLSHSRPCRGHNWAHHGESPAAMWVILHIWQQLRLSTSSLG